MAALGATVFGLSTHTPEFQLEMAQRLHLPFAVLSDHHFEVVNALKLPTMTVDSMLLTCRLTLILEGVKSSTCVIPCSHRQRQRPRALLVEGASESL